MKLVTYNMQHDKKSKDNWRVVFDALAPDIVLAQESLPPDQCQRPLLEESWSENVAWSPVWPQWGSAVYLKGAQRILVATEQSHSHSWLWLPVPDLTDQSVPTD